MWRVACSRTPPSSYTWVVTTVFAARRAAGLLPHSGRQVSRSIWEAPAFKVCMESPACRVLPISPAASIRRMSAGFNGFRAGKATNPQFQNPTSWDPKVNYSLMRGRHALKMGAEMEIIHTEVMDINPVYGLNAYSGQFQQSLHRRLRRRHRLRPAIRRATNLADFIFGLPQPGAVGELPDRQLPAARLQPVSAGRFPCELEADAEPGAALGVCHPRRWERDKRAVEFRPREPTR